MDQIEQPKDYYDSKVYDSKVYDSKVDTTEAGGLAFVCLFILAVTAAIWAVV